MSRASATRSAQPRLIPFNPDPKPDFDSASHRLTINPGRGFTQCFWSDSEWSQIPPRYRPMTAIHIEHLRVWVCADQTRRPEGDDD